MIAGWTIAVLGFGYLGALFALAWIGDRKFRTREAPGLRPLIYALSLAVYCTSWTFFGSVGLAASTGYDFLPVYLGPILMFTLGAPLIMRIVRLAKSQNITSVADFLAARYGKSPVIAALATGVVIAGTLPYMALQLKAIAVSVETLLGPAPLLGLDPRTIDPALVIALMLAAFAVLFGTRHIDATEHQDGLMLAIAAESLIKLAAFLIIGVFAVFYLLGGPGAMLERIRASKDLIGLFGSGFNGGLWLTVTFLSLVCIVLLPRQFHVTVVENHTENEIRRATWLFPLYLVAINLFVVPIAVAGLLLITPGTVPADMFVLGLPLQNGAWTIALIAFIGGISAATAMVIVDGIALAVMISNSFVVPWLLRRGRAGDGPGEDLAGLLLTLRRMVIFAILLLAYLVYRALGEVHALAQIGLISFAAIAQLAPSFFGGLVWKRATARGAVAGIVAGFSVWTYTLLLPWIAKAGWLPTSFIEEGPLGIALLKPQALLFMQFDPLTHGVLWSMLANVLAYVFVSLVRVPEPIERLQAQVFVLDDALRPAAAPGFRLWRTTLTTGDLQQTVARYLGADRTERSFDEFYRSRGARLSADAEADVATLQFTERLLSSAIGAASARLVLALLLKRGNVSSQSALRLLDDASEAIQYNRDLLQSALDQVRHGLTVFDKDMRLICWNRQFRELMNLPPDIGRVGVPLANVLRHAAERGDFGEGDPDALAAAHYTKLAVTRETFRHRIAESGRIIEIRTSPMPQGGIVTTYSDITDRVAASEALARANETLERRVAERTAELAVAKAKADEANLDKTRFLAAASHDILQPLNAARLYATSLAERPADTSSARLARNIDMSLEAVEDILGALLDMSRLDSGHMAPEIQDIALDEIMVQLRVEFEPQARAKGLELTIVPTTLWVRSDRRLLRRMLQNLVSNAVKYTRSGRVLVGFRRRGDRVIAQVIDTGPGIPASKQALIFKEFQRLDETAADVKGLGLGLSIVERIGRVLDAKVSVSSELGKGAMFAIDLARGTPKPRGSVAPILAPIGIDLKGRTVLCIDNEQTILDSMTTLLEGWGCRVIAVETAEAAVEEAQRAGRLDIILADYHLTVGTGLDAVAAIRAATGVDTPVIVVTADNSAEVQQAVQAAGCGLLRKPLKAAALRALFGQHLLRRSAAAE